MESNKAYLHCLAQISLSGTCRLKRILNQGCVTKEMMERPEIHESVWVLEVSHNTNSGVLVAFCYQLRAQVAWIERESCSFISPRRFSFLSFFAFAVVQAS